MDPSVFNDKIGKSVEKQMTKVMKKAFWDLIRKDLEAEPQKLDHLVILIKEIKNKLKNLTPSRRDLHTDIDETLDVDFIRQLFSTSLAAANETPHGLYFLNLIKYLIEKIKTYCAPSMDDEINKWEKNTFEKIKTMETYSEFIPWFFKKLYRYLDEIQTCINKFLNIQV
jgi:DNA phosphorothioation-dependent restriction protein DptG